MLTKKGNKRKAQDAVVGKRSKRKTNIRKETRTGTQKPEQKVEEQTRGTERKVPETEEQSKSTNREAQQVKQASPTQSGEPLRISPVDGFNKPFEQRDGEIRVQGYLKDSKGVVWKVWKVRVEFRPVRWRARDVADHPEQDDGLPVSPQTRPSPEQMSVAELERYQDWQAKQDGLIWIGLTPTRCRRSTRV
ncbi:hypothetical protein BAUCODRAFT_570621 [Baudoinia panamericana UAMH 10762]|uniref:Uncharacterized protein n=1 Tax=Baudoinia panamericana (strain UAMH 10762) TaxID=717646 RepID=M2MKR8_BAUPA|nr:uncharacterized protein BAUCODRAFT_570621 [Baudoinia panamericana UAMH 10762]EMC91928.1 hypothetical protein BAUCODRAFT_570621 [Baudoinia panamericana UAMH 10762]